jgi:nitric oxide reductase subunit B
VFEVFATAIISLLFVHMGLVRTSTATVMVLFATIVFLFGGVLGTFHHLYFTGTPISIIAVGASFSALEVVPLMVVGFEAYNHAKIETQADWTPNYHWPFMFFSAVLFWNLVGAGVFGFLINPPLALYFMQGLNTTANHGHAALFGVYGMLGLGLTLYCVRGLTDVRLWNHKLLKLSFWCLNIGLAMMTFLSLLPQGMWQTYASASHGYAYARSADFMQSSIMHAFVWMRMPGDLVFSLGVGAFALFMYRGFRQQLANGPGYRTDHLLMMSFDTSLLHYTDAQSRQFFDQVAERARTVPGVQRVGAGGEIEFAAGDHRTEFMVAEEVQVVAVRVPDRFERVEVFAAVPAACWDDVDH